MVKWGEHAKTIGCSLAIAVLAAACTSSGRDLDSPRPTIRSKSSPPISGEATIGSGSVDATYALGRDVYGLPGGEVELSGPVYSPLAGALSPAVVVEPGGDSLVYNSWRGDYPVLRVHDLETASDSAVAEGAFSAALTDDALAYFVGLRRSVDDVATHRGHVVVSSESGERGGRWSQQASPYVVVAWAGDHLLVYRRRATTTGVLAFAGPGDMRVLATNAYIVAVSPEGDRVFLSEANTAKVRVVDVATGRTRASLDVTERDPISGRPLQYVSYSGSWKGEFVAAAVSNGLAVFRVADDSVALDQLIGLDPDTFPVGVSEPLFTSDGGSLVASGEYIANPNAAVNRMALVECDRDGLRCEVGPLGPYAQPPRLAHNPSRPDP